MEFEVVEINAAADQRDYALVMSMVPTTTMHSEKLDNPLEFAGVEMETDFSLRYLPLCCFKPPLGLYLYDFMHMDLARGFASSCWCLKTDELSC